MNKLPNGWVETTLGEVAKVQTGPFGSQLIQSQYVTGGVPVVTVEHINDFQIKDFQYPSVTNEDKARLSKYTLKKGDIVFTRVGSVDLSALVKPWQDGWLFSSRMLSVRVDKTKVDPKYLSFFFRQESFRKYILKIAVGATMPSINTDLLKGAPVLLPPISEQQAIAAALSAFDDKIELLSEQNNTLEEIGQVIFQEWFGKYGVHDKLPNGWRVYELSEIVDIINGYTYKGSDLVQDSITALVTLKSFDRNGGFQTRGFKPFIGNPKETQEVKIGDLVVAHTDLTQDAEVLGNPAFIFDDGGFKKMFITMDLVKVVSKYENITNAFLYYLMKTKEFKGHCVGYANGTTVLHLSKKAIPEYQIALPENFGILSDVSLLLKETTDKIADINSQIKTLANTRDEILPKLMSGMIRVNDFNNN